MIMYKSVTSLYPTIAIHIGSVRRLSERRAFRNNSSPFIISLSVEFEKYGMNFHGVPFPSPAGFERINWFHLVRTVSFYSLGSPHLDPDHRPFSDEVAPALQTLYSYCLQFPIGIVQHN